MTPFEINNALETLTLLVDTRERPTTYLERRLKIIGLPYERKKLDFGDYSAKCIADDGRELDFSSSFAIERKMNLDGMA